LDDALREIETALDLDDSDAWSHGVFAQLLFLLKQDDKAEIHFNRAFELNPNDADVAAVFANILVYWGRWQEALTWIGTAKRLNPFPPNLYHWYHALALYSGHEYEQAIKTLMEMRALDRWSHGLLGACYAQIGRFSEARFEAEKFVRERCREWRIAAREYARSRLGASRQVQKSRRPRAFPRRFAKGRSDRLIRPSRLPLLLQRQQALEGVGHQGSNLAHAMVPSGSRLLKAKRTASAKKPGQPRRAQMFAVLF